MFDVEELIGSHFARQVIGPAFGEGMRLHVLIGIDLVAAVQQEFRDGKTGNNTWREPAYWAAWQLVGDWRPIQGL